MAFETPGRSNGNRLAGADLSTHQYKAVVLSGATAILATDPALSVYGILQNKPASGRVCTIMIDGDSKMIAGELITAGAEVAIDATSRGVVAASGETIIGHALTAAGAAGEVFTVSLLPNAARKA